MNKRAQNKPTHKRSPRNLEARKKRSQLYTQLARKESVTCRRVCLHTNTPLALTALYYPRLNRFDFESLLSSRSHIARGFD